MNTKHTRNQFRILMILTVVSGVLPSLGFAAEVWTRKADMPIPRISHSSSVVDGKIYAIGGATARSPSTVATVECSISRSTWAESLACLEKMSTTSWLSFSASNIDAA